MKETKWKKNVRLYYAFRVLCTMNFVMPMFMLFLADKGLTSFQIFVTQAVYTLAELLLTVPSGAFADKVGRKKTLILSTVLYTGAFAGYYFVEGFLHILLVELVFAVSSASFHGTGEAFLYDTLAEARKKNRYKKVLGTAYAIQSFVMGAAGVVGAWMAAKDLALPFLISALPTALSLVPLMFLEEPKRKVVEHESYYKMVKEATVFVGTHKKLRNLMYFVGVTTLAGFMGFMLLQPLLIEMGMSVQWLGFAVLGMSVMSGLGNKFAHRFEKKFKAEQLLFGLAGVRALLYLLVYMASGPYLVVWALLFDFFAGLGSTLVPDWVNRYSKSENRATVLSVSSMSGTLMFSVFSPLLGLYVDAYSTQACYLLLALVLGAYAARQLAVMVYVRMKS